MKPGPLLLAAALAVLTLSPAAVPAGTFVRRLAHTPFPYDGPDPETGRPFFDAARPGEAHRYHTTRTGDVFREDVHYRDNRVLFHLPPAFDPSRPYVLLVYLHGQNAEVEAAAREADLAGQVDRSGANAVLVAPQLARLAWDSSPGAFAQPGTFARFLEEAERAAVPTASPGAGSPVLLAAHSGGGKVLAWVLSRGGVDGRVRGVLLLDALYEEGEKYRTWFAGPGRGTPLLSLSTPLTARGTAELAADLRGRGIAVSGRWPAAETPGPATLVRVTTPHERLPREGPPREPLAAFLRLGSRAAKVARR
jgi:hypothetical protein